MPTRDSLLADLRALKIDGSDTLLIHSSMRSIGEIEGRADAVLDLLMDYFGKGGGLLVMPTLSWNFVNARQPVFSVRDTPCSTGILPELFRQKTGVVRSLHPTHSVAAYGRDAAEFVAGHEKFDTPCAKGSPWWKLIGRHAKILFIGTGINCNTFCHGVDEWLGLTGLIGPDHENLRVITADGRTIEVPSRRHCVGRNLVYESYQERFDRAGVLTHGRFGDAAADLLDARGAAKELGVKFD